MADDIPIEHPATSQEGKPSADWQERRKVGHEPREVGPESEVRGGPEAPEETLPGA